MSIQGFSDTGEPNFLKEVFFFPSDQNLKKIELDGRM